MAFTITIPSCRYDMMADTVRHLFMLQIKPVLKNGENYPSFSKLINECVAESSTEIIIICNDKARPMKQDIQKTLSLIDEGYGFVGLYSFGFFGFKKELMRRMGPLDERFIGGNYEDCDYLRRLNEADIACYITYEIPYLEGSSSWHREDAYKHYLNKWQDATPENLVCNRLLPEEHYDYDFGPSTGCSFLPWNKSIVAGSEWFLDVKVNQHIV
jgi:GT2 family glycosyltransferase